MKKVYSLLVLMIVTAGIMSAQVKTSTSPVLAKGPVITFETTTLDYGTIPHNADGNREFTFTNTGSEDLIIASCSGSCGCTVPECPKEVYGPGESGVIKVKYATDRVGQFTKTVTVNSNATNGTNGVITLTIKGNVLPD